MQGKIRFSAVAAVAENGVIGHRNDMPWYLPSDFKNFVALTKNKPVIMGRKTFESIGKPLKNRDNIVLTRTHSWSAEGVIVVHSVEQAIQTGEKCARRRGVSEIIHGGGGALYSAMFHLLDRLYITRVHLEPEGDTLFPNIDPDCWTIVEQRPLEKTERDTASMTLVVYDRITYGIGNPG